MIDELCAYCGSHPSSSTSSTLIITHKSFIFILFAAQFFKLYCNKSNKNQTIIAKSTQLKNYMWKLSSLIVCALDIDLKNEKKKLSFLRPY